MQDVEESLIKIKKQKQRLKLMQDKQDKQDIKGKKGISTIKNNKTYTDTNDYNSPTTNQLFLPSALIKHIMKQDNNADVLKAIEGEFNKKDPLIAKLHYKMDEIISGGEFKPVIILSAEAIN